MVSQRFFSNAGILGSLFYFNKNKAPKQVKSIPAFFSGQAPYLFAHRGMAVRPEQTQLAFDNAVEYGLDGFETDVRLTQDGKLIVFMMRLSTVLLMVQVKSANIL